MIWHQLKVLSDRGNVQRVEDVLLDCGALSVTLEDSGDQPILEPGVGETPLWSEVTVSALFDPDCDISLITHQFKDQLPNHGFCWETLPDKEWEREWMDKFHPLQCASNLWICPSWSDPPDPKATNLMLDPGLAFGTGTHPTTLLCLQWLAEQPLTNRFLIDYGCGSGILAIAGLLLGADHALCIDNDPQALLATNDNAHRNRINATRFSTGMPDQFDTEPADVLLANILAEPLIKLAPGLASIVKSEGKICLSGILLEQAEQVMAHYQPWFTLDPVVHQENWVRLTGIRNSAQPHA